MVDEKILEEHHKICKTCWSGQDKVIGRRCSACFNHNEYEPIDKIKEKNMADYSKDLYDYTHECMKNCSAFDDGYNKGASDDKLRSDSMEMDFNKLFEMLCEYKYENGNMHNGIRDTDVLLDTSQKREDVKKIIDEWSLEFIKNDARRMAELEGKISAYETIIAKSNFAPIV